MNDTTWRDAQISIYRSLWPRDAHLIESQISNPSKSRPVVLPPARPTRVGNQSETWRSPVLIEPLWDISGLLTNPTAFIPPSHSDFFHPRSGQLIPPLNACPPLSKTRTLQTGTKRKATYSKRRRCWFRRFGGSRYIAPPKLWALTPYAWSAKY